MRIDYLEGRGINYSYGPAVFLGYGLAMVLFFASFLLVLFGKNMDTTFKAVILPMLILMLAGVITQIFVPELLFTGSAITLAVLGVYFAIENPLSIAIGMALSEDGERISEIAKASDERMYLDKSRIKGQI